MTLTHKHLLVDIFLTRSLSKSLAVSEFASVNFEPWIHCVDLKFIYKRENKKEDMFTFFPFWLSGRKQVLGNPLALNLLPGLGCSGPCR